MADLKFAARWFDNRPPAWLGNRDQEKPFTVRVRRISKAELASFRERFRALLERGSATPDELDALFAGVVEGPFGELRIDGKEIRAGDLHSLFEVAALEHLAIGEPLGQELAALVGILNTLSDEAEGKSVPPPGGSGTGDGGSPSPHQQGAPAAASSSPAESTSSESATT
jgi:hypothetical protein